MRARLLERGAVMRRWRGGAWLVLGLVAGLTAACGAAIRGRAHRLERTLEDCGFASGEIEVPGGRMRSWAGGQGPAVLLLHGFGGDVRWQLTDVMCALARDHRVIAPNLFGFGGSAADEPRAVGLLAQADAVAGLMDRLGVRRAAVVGTSYGGLVAYRLATHHEDRVSRLVLVSSPGAVYTRDDLDAMLAGFGVASTRELFLPSDAKGVRRLLDLAYADAPWLPRPAARAAQRHFYGGPEQRAADPRAHLLRTLELELTALSPDAPRPTTPTLLIWGADDPVFPLPIAERLAAHLDARLEVIPHAAHAPNLEHPEAFLERLVPFLGADHGAPTD